MNPNNTPFKCIIVDDSDIDRLVVQSFVKKHPFLQIQGVFSNPLEALEMLRNNPVDVLFLDVDMPFLKGTEMRRRLLDVPACIFITSYPDYALDAFELAALDFIMKPLTAQRFSHSMQRLQAFMEVRQKANILEHTLGQDEIFIKEGVSASRFASTKCFTSRRSRLHARCNACPPLLRTWWPQSGTFRGCILRFVRIHRSYAVQRHYISRIDTQQVHVGTTSLPLGRTYRRTWSASC
jgi:DNA-binding LytR/AlgR family response regulator